MKKSDKLSPFPEGWYFVATRNSILENDLLEMQWCGENIVAWSDDTGTICIARSLCPHLGASLNPSAGGTTRDGRLICPFHGFAYDTTGRCVATPYAEPPGTVRLSVLHTREILGLVFAWHGLDGRAPQWHLPEEPENEGWSRMELRTLRFPGHPQETTENAVDLAHLRYVHGYKDVKQIGAMTVDGPYLASRYDFKRRRRLLRFASTVHEVSIAINVHGLGYSFVDIHERTIGIRSRLWALPTPVDGRLISFVLISQVRALRRPKRLFAGLAYLPMGLRTALMNKYVVENQQRDALQDVVIWGQKEYRVHPRLCRSDGPIDKYRRYCQQFYGDSAVRGEAA